MRLMKGLGSAARDDTERGVKRSIPCRMTWASSKCQSEPGVACSCATGAEPVDSEVQYTAADAIMIRKAVLTGEMRYDGAEAADAAPGVGSLGL
jgi:hypothetical protein